MSNPKGTTNDSSEKRHDSLRHMTYIRSLPSSSDLTTPLYFTESELGLVRGTNLFGAIEDRRTEWQEEWKAVKQVLKEDGLTW